MWIIASAIFHQWWPTHSGAFSARRGVRTLRKELTAVLGTCGEESQGPCEGAQTLTAHGGEDPLDDLGLPTAQTAQLP